MKLSKNMTAAVSAMKAARKSVMNPSASLIVMTDTAWIPTRTFLALRSRGLVECIEAVPFNGVTHPNMEIALTAKGLSL